MYIIYLPGTWREHKRIWISVAHNLLHTMTLGPPPIPPLKIFSPANPEIPIRAEYKSEAPEDWWDAWPKITVEDALNRKTGINTDRFKALAMQHQYPDSSALEKAVEDLTNGADIGVHKADAPLASLPSDSTNAPSSHLYGDRVTDSIVSWIKKGFAMGPFLEQAENPWGEDICVSGLMVKLKSNGKARVILNLSAGFPGPVNAGIDKKDYPTKMSSTTAWIRIMYSCGLGCLFCKNDW